MLDGPLNGKLKVDDAISTLDANTLSGATEPALVWDADASEGA